jgi:hypothetical protein
MPEKLAVLALGNRPSTGSQPRFLSRDPLLDAVADRLTSDCESPSRRSPRQLGMTCFILGDDLQNRPNRRIPRMLERFTRLDRRNGLADAPFGEDGVDQRDEVGRVEAPIDRERARAKVSIGVGARQRKGKLGMLRFVGHRSLRGHDELRRRADCKELQRKSCEGCDRGVLHACDLEPGGSQAVTRFGRQGACGCRYGSSTPVASLAHRGEPTLVRDEEWPADTATGRARSRTGIDGDKARPAITAAPRRAIRVAEARVARRLTIKARHRPVASF